MENDNRFTIRFKHEVDLKNIKFIAKVMNSNPNALIQFIIRGYIKKVQMQFEEDEKNNTEC